MNKRNFEISTRKLRNLQKIGKHRLQNGLRRGSRAKASLFSNLRHIHVNSSVPFADHVREFACGTMFYRTFHMDVKRDALYVGAM